MWARGLRVIDGKRLPAAARAAFRGQAAVQQWCKSVAGCLPRGEQTSWRRPLQRAYDHTDYADARPAARWLGARPRT